MFHCHCPWPQQAPLAAPREEQEDKRPRWHPQGGGIIPHSQHKDVPKLPRHRALQSSFNRFQKDASGDFSSGQVTQAHFSELQFDHQVERTRPKIGLWQCKALEGWNLAAAWHRDKGVWAAVRVFQNCTQFLGFLHSRYFDTFFFPTEYFKTPETRQSSYKSNRKDWTLLTLILILGKCPQLPAI